MKQFSFKIHGNNYKVDVIEVEDNIAQIEVNGSLFEVELEKEIKSAKTPKLIRSSVHHSGDSDRAKTRKPDAAKGTGVVKAPLPGTILEIKIREGDEIKAGDIMLIMEAMKMENEIKSAASGIVKSIKVHQGDAVLEGDVLVEIGG